MTVLALRASKYIKVSRTYHTLSAKSYFQGLFSSALIFPSTRSLVTEAFEKKKGISSNGLRDYIGLTEKPGEQRWATDRLIFKKLTSSELWFTQFNLWRQYPWKKIKGKTILKLKLKGDLQLDSSPSFSLSGSKDLEYVDTLAGVTKLLTYAALDPRVVGIIVDVGDLACGYAKLRELRRYMDFFTQSGKELIGYCAAGSEKQLYIAKGFTKFYVPPDGVVDLRGFSSGAAFIRGVFDKIGIEPQVQRIGKFKSFGDTFNRSTISDAQREVISALILEGSDYWADNIAENHPSDLSRIDVMKQLWESEGVKSPYALKNLGYISGVNYLDQIETDMKARLTPAKSSFQSYFDSLFRTNASDTNTASLSDFSLASEFTEQPRRQILDNPIKTKESGGSIWKLINSTNILPSDAVTAMPAAEPPATVPDVTKEAAANGRKGRQPGMTGAATYLKKMRRGDRIIVGLPVRERLTGPRVAIINAVGGINTGTSSSGSNRGIGSDTVISQLRAVREDSGVKAVVLRIDSPGGSALASDLMWREIRVLAGVKPVVASMVDVAASGGYYMAMACDHIVAEDLTITGSIGVVYSKFNTKELFRKIGYNVEVLSRGRYAEVLSTSRGFTDDEKKFFDSLGLQAYDAFVSKAAASRGLTKEALEEVAQGRVWTGRQALQRGLVDRIGGLATALQVAASAANMTVSGSLPIETIKDSGSRLPFPLSLLSMSSSTETGLEGAGARPDTQIQTLCSDVVAALQLASPATLGIGPAVQKLGLDPVLAFSLSHNEVSRKALELAAEMNQKGFLSNLKAVINILME